MSLYQFISEFQTPRHILAATKCIYDAVWQYIDMNDWPYQFPTYDVLVGRLYRKPVELHLHSWI